MLAILFTILKVIGILLLIVIGLLMLICAAVLFVPVRFVVECRSGNRINLGFRLSWLLRGIQIKKGISERRIHIYLLGINIKKYKKLLRRKKEDASYESEPSQESRVHLVDDFQQEEQRVHVETDYEDEEQTQKASGSHKKSFSFERISGIITFIRDYENKTGLKKVKRELVSLVKYVMPQKIRGKISFGTGDPCTTGWILGGISMFRAAYTEGLTICPDFEEKVFRADGVMSGRIRMIYFLRLFLRGYLDDDIKKIVTKVMRMFGK